MIQAFNLSPSKKLIIPGSFEETIRFCAEHFMSCGHSSVKEHGRFCVALSGGSTPKALFNYLAAHYAKDPLWQHTYLFWGDERAVDPTHAESNYKMAMDSGFSELNIPSSQIFRMHAETAIHAHATEYEKAVKQHVSDCRFDLLMLGMGEDGHTASLFPETQGPLETQAYVIANHIKQKNCWRMTMTFPLINRARCIVFYVTGSSKKAMLSATFHDRMGHFPCSKVGSPSSPALWIVDNDASELLADDLV